MLKKSGLAMSVTVALASAQGAVLAASASTFIPVSVNVSQACSISTTSALAFASYDPIGVNATAALNSTGQISVSCSKGASGLAIGMDAGTHATGDQRKMQGSVAANTLNYSISQPPSNAPGTACTFPGLTPWTNTGAGMLTLPVATSKSARVYNVCGTIPGGQDAAAEAYTDTVSATLNF
jgi:spore coat protein U-like protein